ncbi:hypothetical protein Tco_0951380 [Tanacetum coccineum]|uniref:Uncharacterized protein n=1 Tax=Tanacetum coccineum TaxID=301880 RepID=A0ABQ5DTZ1_9ASTR
MTGFMNSNKETIDKAYSIGSIKTCIPSPLMLISYNTWNELCKRFCTHGLDKHLASTASSTPTPEFAKTGSLVVMWLYATVSPKLVDMVLDPDVSAFDILDHLKKIFHDKKIAASCN